MNDSIERMDVSTKQLVANAEKLRRHIFGFYMVTCTFIGCLIGLALSNVLCRIFGVIP